MALGVLRGTLNTFAGAAIALASCLMAALAAIGRIRVLLLLALLAIHGCRLVVAVADSSASGPSISPTLSKSAPKSVLAALLESSQSNFMELVERAGLLAHLESSIGEHNLTIFAPSSDFFEQHFDRGFRSYILAPSNAAALQKIVLSHIVPRKISSSQWENASFASLSSGADRLRLRWARNGKMAVNGVAIDRPDMIVRSDGIAHGINGLLVPKSVEQSYVAFRSKNTPAAVGPVGAPTPPAEEDPDSSSRKHRSFIDRDASSRDRRQRELPSDVAAPACAPSPSFGGDVDALVEDFIDALVNYGEYREIAALLVNLTSLASDMGRLVSEGHSITLLAPNDQAIDQLTTKHLNAPGGIEAILTYHILAEYQTEESLYTLARTSSKLHFSTLRPNLKLEAQEVDGTVQFGSGKWSGLLLDANIFADGRISVQGINKVLLPPDSTSSSSSNVGRKLLRFSSSRSSTLSSRLLKTAAAAAAGD